MIDLTFNDDFADTLHQKLKVPVISLQLDLQIGNLHRLRSPLDPFWQLKAKYETNATSAQLVATIHQQLARLRKTTDAGEALRVWWSDTADDVLGLMWLCNRLADTQLPVVQVKVPLTEPNYQNRDVLMQFATLGEIDPSMLSGYLEGALPLSHSIQQTYSYRWRALASDNAPLRVNLNGHVVSVPETFYDGALQQVMLKTRLTPVSFAKRRRIVGETLSTYPIGVPGWWYAYRLDFLNDYSKIKRH
ncbi:DUF3658 domain-containing protein [Secundilactobacillus paracollinoides]|uniref:DUF3658 domain-containing protein n=1 Tax=Secundilactobacillus paracollinoides TaxID=240427 RepID=UPI00081A4B93|nr:DUF3658 domain-containing protein [Secundilactobacillus paracollinoides]ANZ60566.1 hypothetical protein AYR61_03870 [Secundilactobacillus paracollinoides]